MAAALRTAALRSATASPAWKPVRSATYLPPSYPQDLLGDLGDAPADASGLVPMNMQLDFAAARLEIRMDINEMVSTQSVIA